MDNVTDEIKSRLDIVEVIQEYLPQLKQAGANWKTLCPFHNEKSPSFTVSREKQIWHCFGCSEGGDIFSFVMKMEGVEFVDALRILAKKANVILKKQDQQLTNQRARLLDICQLSANFYHQILIKMPSGEIARKYFTKRKISSPTAKDFQLGFAPDSWENLTNFLLSKGFKENEIVESGMAIKSANLFAKNKSLTFFQKKVRDKIYDRFRNRLMFPICDVHENVIGFSGRILEDKKDEAKYINTPQTLIYNKSQVLYGLNKAKQEIRKENLAVMVEGNMDVISSHQAGIKNVIACSGTALTLEQIKLLKRYSFNLALAFDIDPAGQKATKRGIDNAWQQEMNIKIIKLPEGKDPDECIKKDANVWQKAIKDSQSIMEYYFDSVFLNSDLSKVENKKSAAKILLPIISKLTNKIEQAHWLQKLGEFLNIDEQILRDSIIKKNASFNSRSIIKEKNDSLIDKQVSLVDGQNLLLEEKIIGMIFKFHKNLKKIILEFPLNILQNKKLSELAKNFIKDYIKNEEKFTEDKWIKSISKEMTDYFNTLIFTTEKDFSDFDSSIEYEIQKNINILKKNKKKNLKK
ncbi:DNA primase [Candidatus Kuenenbacteria bacterium]|nr:DNA primase [Candidatus Kuenenbacteria bacterium]